MKNGHNNMIRQILKNHIEYIIIIPILLLISGYYFDSLFIHPRIPHSFETLHLPRLIIPHDSKERFLKMESEVAELFFNAKVESRNYSAENSFSSYSYQWELNLLDDDAILNQSLSHNQGNLFENYGGKPGRDDRDDYWGNDLPDDDKFFKMAMRNNGNASQGEGGNLWWRGGAGYDDGDLIKNGSSIDDLFDDDITGLSGWNLNGGSFNDDFGERIAIHGPLTSFCPDMISQYSNIDQPQEKDKEKEERISNEENIILTMTKKNLRSEMVDQHSIKDDIELEYADHLDNIFVTLQNRYNMKFVWWDNAVHHFKPNLDEPSPLALKAFQIIPDPKACLRKPKSSILPPSFSLSPIFLGTADNFNFAFSQNNANKPFYEPLSSASIHYHHKHHNHNHLISQKEGRKKEEEEQDDDEVKWRRGRRREFEDQKWFLCVNGKDGELYLNTF